jgi:flagellar hook-associated protein 3 FlgL
MRIADKMAFNQVNKNIAKNRTELSGLQNEAATQKRVGKPSDDPTAAARVLVQRGEEKTNEQFLKNLNTAKSFLEFTDQSLGDLTDGLIRAKELALSQANDASGNGQSRKVTATEIGQLYDQAVQIANRKLGERYVFSGHKTTTMPFDITGNYHGDDGEIKIQTNKDSFVAMNLSGDKLFLGLGLGEDGFIRPRYETPRNVDELNEFKDEELERTRVNQERFSEHVVL